MSSPHHPGDDERLLEALKDALDADAGVTDETIDMLMTGYDIVHADVIEADLVFDSAADAAVRQGSGGDRHLRFEYAETVIEVEVDVARRRISGRVNPHGGELSLEQLGGSRPIAVPGGAFEEYVDEPGPFRLSYTIGEQSVVSSWLRLSAD